MEFLNTGSEPDQRVERRQYQRVARALPFGFSVLDMADSSDLSGSTYDAEALDIGVGGLACNAVIDEDALVKRLSRNDVKLALSIRLPERETDICPKADVAWIYNLKGLSIKTKYGLGLRFLGMSEEENRLLSSYVEDLITFRHKQRTENRWRIKQVMARIARVDEGRFSEATRIREDLGVDSLMAMETLAALESIYNIEIDVGKAFDVVTVGDMMDLIESYTNKR